MSNLAKSDKPDDLINHPPHYTNGPVCECGRVIECIAIAERMGFALGNVIKYLWRADHKGAPIDDLKKARWYLDREIFKRDIAG